jgi:hypothetical protein
MTIDTITRPFSVLYAANTTASSITTPVPTVTPPTKGDNGFLIMDQGSYALFQFFGTTTADQTMVARLTAWRRVNGSGSALWVPSPLLLLALTLGTPPGVAATPVDASQLFADTIVVTTKWIEDTAFAIKSAGDNTVAEVKIDVAGAEYVQVQLHKNASAVSCNALGLTY